MPGCRFQHTGNPAAPLANGEPLRAITRIEQRLIDHPREREVRRLLTERAAVAVEQLADVPRALAEGRAALEGQLAALRAAREASIEEVRRIEEALAHFPRDEQAAREAWLREAALAERAAAPIHHGEAFAGRDEAARDAARCNFLALVACLMLGTAGLPHLLVRYYTTPDAQQARSSVVWTLGFVSVLYLTAPALAVLVKYVVYHDRVGSAFNDLPAWGRAWIRVDASLLSLSDVNRDGMVQLAEIALGQDVVVLAMPEIAGLPHVMSALVAAGALAAALSTADGLLLTIGNALSHDLCYKMVNPQAPAARRVLLSKVLLLALAVLAAMAAARRPADILFLVAAAFSLATASLFPALVLGIAWKRATGIGAVLGMLTGFAVTAWYMVRTQPWLREAVLGVPRTVPIEPDVWWGIQPTAAGVFGLAAGFAVTMAASLATPEPAEQTQRLVERLRFPRAGAGD